MARPWTILLLLLAAGALLAAAPAAADPPANASSDEDVRGQAAAASVHGNATCSGVHAVDFLFGFGDSCLALSGTGTARGEVAASLGGPAHSCDYLLVCVAASGTGPASGTYAASLLGDADGGLAGVSAEGDAEGFAAVTGTGDAEGLATVSGTGEASSCESILCAALSGTGPAQGGIAASVLGDAHGDDVAVSGAGNASSPEWIAASLLGQAVGEDLALSAAGDADSPEGYAASLLGDAAGERAAASAAGNATSDGGPAASLVGDARGATVAASAAGDAEGDIAVSGTGDADARFLALSGTGNATQECDIHPPISVVGDEGLTGFAVTHPITGESVPRPGSGVVAGDGTEENPYVIAGWCIRGSETGIRLVNTTAHVVIRDNSLRNLGTGIRTVEAENVTVRENDVTDTTVAARFTGGDGPDVLGNRLVGHGQLGLAVEDAPGALVADNDLLAGGAPGSPPGIQVDGADGATVRENVLVGHGPAVNVLQAQGVTVLDNQVVANQGDGIAFAGAADLAIRGNNVTGNEGTGIDGSRSAEDVSGATSQGVLVEGNRLVDNGDLGLHAEDAEDLEIRDNEVRRNHDHGILLGEGVDGALVTANTVHRNGWGWDHGVLLQGANDTTIRDNVVTENRVGVRSLGSSNVTVAHNDVVDNLKVGVGMNRFNAHVSVHHNAILGNGNSFYRYWQGGATLTGVTDVAFYENEVRDNTWYGVEIHLNQGATVRDNTIADNAAVGILTRDDARSPTIDDNTVTGHVVDVLLSSTREAALSGNTMERGLLLTGENSSHYDHDVDATNTVAGEPLRFVTTDGATVDGPAGQVVVAGADEVTVPRPSLANVTAGVQLHDTRNATVENATVDDVDLGLYAERSVGATVRATNVTDADAGLGLVATNDSTVADVRIRDTPYGLLDLQGRNNTVRGSAVNGTVVGAFLGATENATVSSSRVVDATAAVYSFADANTILRDNRLSSSFLDELAYYPTNLTMDGNTMEEGLYVYGEYNHTIPETNTVEGEPVLYRLDAEDVAFDGSYGQAFLPGASNVTLRDATVDGAAVDLFLVGGQDVTVEDTTLSGGVYGLLADGVDDLVLSNATLEENGVGALVAYSPQVSLVNGTVRNNSLGLFQWANSGAEVNGTNLTGNGAAGAFFYTQAEVGNSSLRDNDLGLFFWAGDGSRVRGNAFEANELGTLLLLEDADVSANTFEGGVLDVYLVWSESLTLEENAMDRGLLVLGSSQEDYDHDVDASNTVDGDPVRYLHGQDGATVPRPAGQVVLAYSDDVTVSGGTWDDVAIPVQAHRSEGVRVDNVTANDTWMGALLYGADDATAADNALRNGTYGLLTFGYDQVVEGNRLADNDLGAAVTAWGGAVRDNTLENDLDLVLNFAERLDVDRNAMESGLRLAGWYRANFNHSIAPTNTVQGDPVRYLFREDGATVPRPAGQVVLAYSDDVTVDGGTWDGVAAPVQAYELENLTVEDVAATDANAGVFLSDVADATVSNVTVTASDVGLQGNDVFYSRITASTFAGNDEGMRIWDAYGNRVDNNTVDENAEEGIRLDGDYVTNRIVDNNVTRNGEAGIDLVAIDAGEEVHGNNIEGNDVGLVDSPWGPGPDATDNWWGCPDGPDATACDGVRGGDVTYDPWLTAPNPEAGDR